MVQVVLAHPVNHKIFQEYLHKGWDVLTKYVRNDSLECCWCDFQPEHHNHYYEYPPFRYECRLFLVFGMHAGLVISAKTVQKTVHLMPCDGVQHAIRKWQGKRCQGSCGSCGEVAGTKDKGSWLDFDKACATM